MKSLRHSLSIFAATALCGALLISSTCIAQDAGTQAPQQSTDLSTQAAQQVSQQTQQAQQNMQQSSSSAAWPTALPGIFPQQPTGPLPGQIASAHTILLTNAGISPRLAVDSNQLYNDIHARLASWGKYQLVSSPDQADLVFQLSIVDPRTGYNGQAVPDAYGRSPLFLMVIVDAHTGTPLWSITSPLYLIGKRNTAAHWLALSEDNLVSRIKVVANQSLDPGETAQLTTYPKNHNALVAGIVVGGVIGLGVGGFLIAHHEFENSLASMKASQDAFCKANNIPLSECAGG